MRGIYGFATRQSSPNSLNRLREMCNALPFVGDAYRWETVSEDKRVALGIAQHAWKGERGHVATTELGHFCLFDGVLFDPQGDSQAPVVESADTLLNAYLLKRSNTFADFNGSFNAVIWDPKTGRLTLFNDKVGHRPLYYGFQRQDLVFGSYLANIMASQLLHPEIELGGLVDLIQYGFITSDATLFKDVHLLPPGSILVLENGRITLSRYWRCDEDVKPHGHIDADRIAELSKVLERSVNRSLGASPSSGLGLTGGFDSRALLTAALSSEQLFVTHSGGRDDSTDVVAARQLSSQCGIRHIVEPLGPDRVAEWLFPMVLFQGAGVATLHSHPCHTFEFELPFDAMIQGIGGEFARGADWVSPDTIRNSRYDRDLLRSKLQTGDAQRLPQRGFWREEYQSSVSEHKVAHLDAMLTRYNPQDHPLAALKFMSLFDLSRSQLNKALVIVRAKREAWCPYLDHEWVEAVASIPIQERVGGNLQLEIIRHLQPQLLQPIHTKTLLPMGASPFRKRIATRFRKFTRRAASLTGWPLYKKEVWTTDYPNWIRNEMQSTIRSLLYSPDAAHKEYLRDAGVERLFEEHFAGRADWYNLIAALTVFEIAHKLWIEGNPTALSLSRESGNASGKVYDLTQSSKVI